MKIKLCGMMREQDIDYANQVKPDYVGFIFANTRRLISHDMAKKFREKLDSQIQAVGVFVDESVEVVADLLNQGIIDIAQLHGAEDMEYIEKLRSLANAPIIKAIKVRSQEDIEYAKTLSVDYLLFDAFQPGKLGGTGTTFDWNHLKEKSDEIKVPFFLAGGLQTDNLKEAMTVGSFGLDISSGIEKDGYKDLQLMQETVNIVREK